MAELDTENHVQKYYLITAAFSTHKYSNEQRGPERTHQKNLRASQGKIFK